MNYSLFKKIDNEMTAWDLNCRNIVNSTKNRRNLKKKIKRAQRKKLNKLFREKEELEDVD